MEKKDMKDPGSPGITRWQRICQDNTDRLWKDCWWPATVEKLCHPMCSKSTED